MAAAQGSLKEDVAKRVATKVKSAIYVRVGYGSGPTGMVIIGLLG